MRMLIFAYSKFGFFVVHSLVTVLQSLRQAGVDELKRIGTGWYATYLK
ncbi:hypothetical protein [Paenibacillus odorifer]|nr:hypothetical protein [Paenibacillus odorifer]